MATIEDYEREPSLALIDALTDPIFKQFIDESDKELLVIDSGDGTQRQVQALSARSVKVVIERIIARAKTAKIDMEQWICSPAEFDLCSKLKTTPGKLMHQLNDFLKNKFAEGGIAAAGLGAAFGPLASIPIVNVFLSVFSAVVFVNKAIVEVCKCP